MTILSFSANLAWQLCAPKKRQEVVINNLNDIHSKWNF